MPDRCLLTVHAHPDDESEFGGGTVARYHQDGVRTVLVCCTDGGLGRILNPEFEPAGGQMGVVEIRRQELQTAAAIIGYDEVIRLEYPDSGPAGPAERAPSSFARAPLDEVAGRIAEVIRRERPQVVISYADDQRAYPHPDHLRAHEAAIRAFDLAGSPAAWPQAGPPWQPAKLYYTVTSAESRHAINERFRQLGMEAPFSATGGPGFQGRGAPDLAPRRERVTTIVDVAPFVQTWISGVRAHQCQLKPELAQMLSIPPQAAADVFGSEEFILVRDLTQRQHGLTNDLETDLFAGVA